ncbi:hypothetical protein [Carboxylicivirga taeanensis]|uniref:hypothetical protein n=1 Tax=Carboxylicivirga taeanensis TaxID=1416875 RepID=UPI003F6E2618
MENRLKHYLSILFAVLIFVGCSDDEDTPELIALTDSTIGFEVGTVDAMIIGESTELKTIRFTIAADWNVSEATKVNLSLDGSSDVPTEAYSYPTEVPFRKGLQSHTVEMPLDCSLIPFDDQERYIKLNLVSEECPLGEINQIAIKVYRNVPTPNIAYQPTFWGWENGDWYEWDDVTMKRGERSWIDLNLWSWGWCGLWDLDGSDIILHSIGHPIGAVADGEGYKALVLKEGDVINQTAISWFDKRGMADSRALWDLQPKFKDEWFGQTAYLAIRMVVDDVEVNGWIQVAVNADGSSVTLIDMAYETQGLTILAGQTE